MRIDDPLAELARVVGYDPRRGERPDDLHELHSGMDLEAELLRELNGEEDGGPAEEPWFRDEDATGHGQDSGRMAVGEHRSEMNRDESFDHDQLSADIGLSLEDELMRDLQGEEEVSEVPAEDRFVVTGAPDEPQAVDYEPQPVDNQPDAPEEPQPRDETPQFAQFAQFAIDPASIRLPDHGEPAGEAAAPVSEEVAAEAAVEEFAGPSSRVDAPEPSGAQAADGATGFAFPSEDELEEDSQFASSQWDWSPPAADDRQHDETLHETPVDDSVREDEPAAQTQAISFEDLRVQEEQEDTAGDGRSASAASAFADTFSEDAEQQTEDDGGAEHAASMPAAEDAAVQEPAAGPVEGDLHEGSAYMTQEDAMAATSDPVEPEWQWPQGYEASASSPGEDPAEELASGAGLESWQPEDTSGYAAGTEFASGGGEPELREEEPEGEDAYRAAEAELPASNVVRLYDRQAGNAPADAGPGDGEDAGFEDAFVALPLADDEHAAGFDSTAMETALAEELAAADEEPAAAGEELPAADEEPAAAVEEALADADAGPAESRAETGPADEGAAPEVFEEGASEPAAVAASQAPSALESAAAVLSAQGSEGAGVFDPAALIEHDEKVEPTFELDIPYLPGDDRTYAPAADDFQMDIDADMIELFRADTEEPVEAEIEPAGEIEDAASKEPYGVAAAVLAGGVETRAVASGRFESVAPASIDFDDLEKALDEDLGDGAMANFTARSEARPREVVVGPQTVSPRGPRWQSIGAGVAAIVLVGAVAVLGWEFMQPDAGIGDGGGPRIIAANKNPVKQKPADPGGKAVPNQNKIVYDKVDGSKSDGSEQKSLVSSTETPVDVVQRTLQPELPREPGAASGEPDGMPGSGAGAAQADGGAATPSAGEGTGKSQARLAPAPQPSPQTQASNAPAAVVPHYVKTMTVTADGKLVPREPDAAPASGQSATPQVAAPDQQSSGQAPGVQGLPAKVPAAGPGAAAPTPLPVARPKAPTTPPPARASASGQAATPAVAPAPSTSTPVAKSPAARPAETKAAASPAPAAPAKPGGYMIQIASQPTEAGAKASYQNLARRFGSVIGGKGVDIQKADIAGKGVYYRVRVPAGSRQDAITLCQNYKAAGGSCYVTR